MTRLLPFCLLLLLAACAAPDAAGQITVTQFRGTAEADQYLRDARATQAAREATVQALAVEIERTAQAAAETERAIAAANAQAALDATATISARIAADAQATAAANVVATQHREAALTATAAANTIATQQRESELQSTTAAHVAATGTAVVVETQTAIRLDVARAAAERSKVVTVLGWGVVILFGVVIVGALAAAVKTLLDAWRLRSQVVTYGPNGNPLVLAHNGRALTIIEPLRNSSAITTLTGDGVVTSDTLSESTKAMTIFGALHVLGQQAQHNPFPPVPALYERPRRLTQASDDFPRLLDSQSAPVIMPTEAPWQMLSDYAGLGLPLGVGAQGLLTANPEQSPHLLIAGTSGSGKTRYGLRPLIAAALAAHWQVLIFDRSGGDFSAFRDCAILTVLAQPAEAVHHLALIHAEMMRRLNQVAASGASTWGRAGQGARLLCVFDEFSNLADSMSDRDRAELWRYARMVAAEGRKAGVHLALALQDPTHRSIDLRIRRNCTPIAFRVRDGEASRVVLGAGGAESLPPRQFLAVLDSGLARGVAFAPSDAQLAAFVAGRATTLQPAPAWLTAPQSALSADNTTERIRALHATGASRRAIEREIFGYAGGAATERVRAALEAATTLPGAATTGVAASGE